jgi:glycosyl transferase family 1
LDQHLPFPRPVLTLLMTENIEHALDRQREIVTGRSTYSWTDTQKLEIRAWSRADACGAVTITDADHIQRAVPGSPVYVIPVGVNHLRQDSALSTNGWSRESGRLRVVFLGNYSWEPSLDAAWFLLVEIWPSIAATLPSADLVLAGADVPGDLIDAAKKSDRVMVTGPLDSIQPILRNSDLFLCPLRFGGGVMWRASHADVLLYARQSPWRGYRRQQMMRSSRRYRGRIWRPAPSTSCDLQLKGEFLDKLQLGRSHPYPVGTRPHIL